MGGIGASCSGTLLIASTRCGLLAEWIGEIDGVCWSIERFLQMFKPLLR